MSATASNEEKPKSRAPRRRATGVKTARKTATKKAVGKRAPRKRAAKKVAPTPVRGTSSREKETSIRKAPTPIAANRASSKYKQKQLIVLFSVVVVSLGLSAAVGFSDKGQIDVNQEIEARNERIRSGQSGGGGTQNTVVPVQNTEANKLPDGGLIGLGAPPPKPKPVTTNATSTSTSTDAAASSTDTAVEEGVQTESDAEITDESEMVTEQEPATEEEIVVEPTSGR